jgi:amidase
MKNFFAILLAVIAGCSQPVPFNVVEATVDDAHHAFTEGTLTAVGLTQMYLDRIEAFDDSLNAFIILNPHALDEAAALDLEYATTGILRPLHGIPIVVKDNYDTAGLQTTAGSAALAGLLPPDDAFQVRKLKEAGAIILGKTNMAEWAFSPFQTVSSIDGTTRNPYDLSRVPAGSSGGTAAAVAANLGMFGLGTDTGNSIRGPSGHNALVGIRSTMGLTSRDGIVPLYLRNDIGGPMARTVTDAARVLDVIAGYDPADPITGMSADHQPESYLDFLDPDGLKGARIGVFRWYMRPDSTHPDILREMEAAIEDMRAAGAVIIDPFEMPTLKLEESIWCEVFAHDVEAYFATRGPDFPYKTLADILETGLYDPSIKSGLEYAVSWTEPPCPDVYTHQPNIDFRNTILSEMETYGLDAIVYPTWSYPARKIGDMESPAGDNSQYLSPQTGFPAIQVPIGFTGDGLPVGMTFLGRLFDEPLLLRLAFGYETHTQKRRPPAQFQ